FLRKDVEDECRRYYELLKGAKVIVNPTPKWAAYSSLIEAMYFYTPVIVSPFDDFVQEFGETIDFGRYNREFSADCIAGNIRNLLESTDADYSETCKRAHEAVKDYTWSRYVDKVLKLCEK
ncbi:MAG: glycosyltransferase, partial [Prevotella sp.]|nr:glycosyltransferase [Prevotella sp.]